MFGEEDFQMNRMRGSFWIGFHDHIQTNNRKASFQDARLSAVVLREQWRGFRTHNVELRGRTPQADGPA